MIRECSRPVASAARSDEIVDRVGAAARLRNDVLPLKLVGAAAVRTLVRHFNKLLVLYEHGAGMDVSPAELVPHFDNELPVVSPADCAAGDELRVLPEDHVWMVLTFDGGTGRPCQ